MPSVKYLASGHISEETIHKTVMEWVRLHPTIKKLVMHFPNEGKRSIHYGCLLKDMGMRAGVSDLFIAMGCHGFLGAWIELKSASGCVSALQKEFLEDMKQQGYYTAVCWSIDDAIAVIDWYCFKDRKEYHRPQNQVI